MGRDTDAERPNNAFPCGAWEREGVRYASCNARAKSPRAVQRSSRPAVGRRRTLQRQRVPWPCTWPSRAEELELLRTAAVRCGRCWRSCGVWTSEGMPAARFPRPLDYLRRLAAAHRALVIHGNYLDDEEIAFLGANAAADVRGLLPADATTGSPTTPIRWGRCSRPGVTVALGTDGRGSSPDLSLLAEMRFAARRHPAVRPGRDSEDGHDPRGAGAWAARRRSARSRPASRPT